MKKTRAEMVNGTPPELIYIFTLHMWHLSARSRRLYLASSLRSNRRGLSAQVHEAILRAILYTFNMQAKFLCSLSPSGMSGVPVRLLHLIVLVCRIGPRPSQRRKAHCLNVLTHLTTHNAPPQGEAKAKAKNTQETTKQITNHNNTTTQQPRQQTDDRRKCQFSPVTYREPARLPIWWH
jgi:hypothetical protein